MENKKIALLEDSDNTPNSKLYLLIKELSCFGQTVVKHLW